MLKDFKNFTRRAMNRLGLSGLAHQIFAANKLTILIYHGVLRSPLPIADWCFMSQVNFRMQMAWLKKHFHVLPLSTALQRLWAGDLQKPTVAITFDDGYQNTLDVAF